jgi:oxygen-independent coproporphyrinogen-3 oxidase
VTGSIYLHIPYCVKKCSYCDFTSYASSSLTLGEYTELLSLEMTHLAPLFPQLSFTTLYFGGGTPSLLPPEQVAFLIEKVRSCFCLAEDAEVTLEANPGTVTMESLQGYRSAGVNRLSIGVQSLRDRDLTILGRIHTANEARCTVQQARSAGFSNIGIDLMHSLPGQSMADWENTLHEAVNLNLQHISAYGLSVEADTPLAEIVERGDLQLPDEDLAAAMFELTTEALESAGFEHYEISNFARPGCRSRHNQVYWQRGNYLGLGAGAHSFVRQPGFGRRWENPPGLQEYGEYLQSPLPKCAGETVSRAAAMSEFFFLGLRLLEGVDLGRFRAEFGIEAAEAFPGVIERFVGNRFLLASGDTIRLSRKGLLLANRVLCEFV